MKPTEQTKEQISSVVREKEYPAIFLFAAKDTKLRLHFPMEE